MVYVLCKLVAGFHVFVAVYGSQDYIRRRIEEMHSGCVVREERSGEFRVLKDEREVCYYVVQRVALQ